MIVNFELLLYCLLAGAVYLLVVDFLWNQLERLIPTFQDFPKELLENKNIFWFFSCYIVELIFFVILPATIYGWFYAVLPIAGMRGAVAIGLFLVIFGMTPFAVLLAFRVKLPIVYILYQLTGLLFKIIGTMAIIGYLYSL